MNRNHIAPLSLALLIFAAGCSDPPGAGDSSDTDGTDMLDVSLEVQPPYTVQGDTDDGDTPEADGSEADGDLGERDADEGDVDAEESDTDEADADGDPDTPDRPDTPVTGECSAQTSYCDCVDAGCRPIVDGPDCGAVCECDPDVDCDCGSGPFQACVPQADGGAVSIYLLESDAYFCRCHHGCGPGIDGSLTLALLNAGSEVEHIELVEMGFRSEGDDGSFSTSDPGGVISGSGWDVPGSTHRVVDVPVYIDTSDIFPGDYRIELELEVSGSPSGILTPVIAVPFNPDDGC